MQPYTLVTLKGHLAGPTIWVVQPSPIQLEYGQRNTSIPVDMSQIKCNNMYVHIGYIFNGHLVAALICDGAV